MGTRYPVLARSTTTLSSTISSTMSSKLLLILVLLVVVAAVNGNFYKKKGGGNINLRRQTTLRVKRTARICAGITTPTTASEKTNLCILFKENSVKMNNKGKPKTI